MSAGRVGSERRLARALSGLLAAGLVIAVALLLTGVVVAAARPDLPVGRQTSFVGLIESLAAGEPGGFFGLGFVVLLATPAARVVGLLIAFVRRRAWVFVGAALLVLAILVTSGYLGLVAG